MPMNGKMLAQEMLAAIGGKVTKARKKAFEAMAEAIVNHIQQNGVVTVTDPQGGVGTGKVL